MDALTACSDNLVASAWSDEVAIPPACHTLPLPPCLVRTPCTCTCTCLEHSHPTAPDSTDQPRFRAALRGVGSGSSGAYVVFLLRLSPLVPFNLLNYACGLTPVGLAPYVAASWAGMLPGTFAYVYLGGAGRAAVDAAASGGASMGTSQLVLYGECGRAAGLRVWGRGWVNCCARML